MWNLAVEQHQWWRPGRAAAPGYLAQCRQLTAARADNPWLAKRSQMVQQQAREARESQAVFRCRACGYCGNADVNAAINIAAGRAVTARGRPPLGGRLNREPQLELLLVS